VGTPVREAAAPVPAQPGPEKAPGTLEELRETLIRSLKRDRGILASGIEKTLPWEWADPPAEEKLLLPVRDTLTAELLKKDYSLIRQILGELWGKALVVEVVETPSEAEEKTPDLPPQAEMVRRMFRGTVVKKTITEKKDGNQSL
jgi:DNA polymerase-3 subunit gamma/tau